MDCLTFIAELVKASAWPIAVVLLALVFRAHLASLLGRIRKGKFGEAELEFAETVKDVGRQSPTLHSLTAFRSSVLLANNPRTAILDAWQQVEDTTKLLAQGLGLSELYFTSRPVVLIREIERRQVLTQSQVDLFKDLRLLRNEAAQSADFSPSIESALRYVQLAVELQGAIEQAISSAVSGQNGPQITHMQ